jgi:hypothetical protein
MRNSTRYEIARSTQTGGLVVWDILTGKRLGSSSTEASARALRVNIARRTPPTLFIPELDGETFTAQEFDARTVRDDMEYVRSLETIGRLPESEDLYDGPVWSNCGGWIA